MGEVYDFGTNEANVVLVPYLVDSLSVVHDEKRLSYFLFQVVLYVFSVSFESNELAPCDEVYILDHNFVVFVRMKLNLLYLLRVTRTLREEDSLIVSAHHVSSKHGLGLTDSFEDGFVE